MSLINQIKEDCLTARKNRSQREAETLRCVLGEVERLSAKDHSDDVVIGVLRKYLKNLEEIRTYGEGIDKAECELEITIIAKYLPQPMSDEEYTNVLVRVHDNLGGYMKAVKEYAKEHGKLFDGARAKKLFK